MYALHLQSVPRGISKWLYNFSSEEASGAFYGIASRTSGLIQETSLSGGKKTVVGRPCDDKGCNSQNFVEGFTNQESPEFNHSEHYIYVTYPPDLKRRLLERSE